ncbi:MAG: ribosomal-processing cysteine protease Prp [Blautia sp.]|nr:ribosomal-processing cysteine protease Prp [Blautia sp.]
MISIRFERSKGCLCFFESKGHAEFEEEGLDIVCAAVSALSINAANSLEALTEDDFTVDTGEGYLSIRLQESPSKEAQLLMESLALGLQAVEKDYGSQYVRVRIQEVS